MYLAETNIELVDLPPGVNHPGLERRKPVGGQFKDLTGTVCGGITVRGFAGYIDTFSAWLCQCACGTYVIWRSNRFSGSTRLRGLSVSCGQCIDFIIPGPEYEVWLRIKNSYAGTAWDGFADFLKDLGRMGDAECLIKTEFNVPYTKQNCHWGSFAEQQYAKLEAQRRYFDAMMVEADGQRLSVKEWANKLGLSHQRIRQRLEKCHQLGAPFSEAVTTPAGQPMPCMVALAEMRQQDVAERKRILEAEALQRRKAEAVVNAKINGRRIHKRLLRKIQDDWANTLADELFDGQVHIIHPEQREFEGVEIVDVETATNILRNTAHKRGVVGRTRSLGGGNFVPIFRTKRIAL